MDRFRFLTRIAWLVSATVVFAGCAGVGGTSGDGAEYEGEFKEFDLYLFAFTSKNGVGGWDLYPGANVDYWGWSPENDRTKASIPGPEIRVREGDTVRVNFHMIGVPMAHTIHWHGIHVPWDQDGVPYVSQAPIGQKEFGGNGQFLVTYEFQVNQSGTYWYHCHVDTAHHLDMGMYGALIVEPKDPKQDPPFDKEVTFVLDEWDRSHAHQNADAIAAAISRSGDPKTTANDVYATLRDYLLMNQFYNDTVAGARVGNQPVPGVREERNWYPVTYAPYFAEYDTFLINGRAFPLTQPVMIKTGEILRMRFINAGEQVHAMHIHGHHMFVTHKDGYVVPLLKQLRDASGIRTPEEMSFYAQAHDTILIGPGERYDAYLYADNPGPWHLHDHISLNEQNDFIAPGGMALMICYLDGWENADEMCKKGHELHNRGEIVTSGDLLNWQYQELVKKDPNAAVAGGGSLPGGVSDPAKTQVPAGAGASPSATGPLGTSVLPIPVVQHSH